MLTRRLARLVAGGLGFVLVVFGVVFFGAVTFSLDRSPAALDTNVSASGFFVVAEIKKDKPSSQEL